MAPNFKSPNIVPLSTARGWRASSGKLLLALPGTVSGPELPLTIAYVGLSDSEQQVALASFPGARRCTLIPNLCRPAPIYPLRPNRGN